MKPTHDDIIEAKEVYIRLSFEIKVCQYITPIVALIPSTSNPLKLHSL